MRSNGSFFNGSGLNGLGLLLQMAVLLFASAQVKAAGSNGGREANRELSDAVAKFLIKEGNFEAAGKHLEKHLAQDATDAKAWNTLGLVRMQQQSWREAGTDFAKAAEYTASAEERAVYLYNKADAASRAGEEEQSRRDLELAGRSAQEGLVSQQILRARNVLKAGQPLPPLRFQPEPERKNLSGSLSVKSGYDTNTVLLPDSQGGKPSPASPFVTPTAQGDFSTEIARGRFGARLVGSFTDYTLKDAKTSNSVYLSEGLEWGPRVPASQKFSFTIGNRNDITFVNTTGKMQLFGVTNTSSLNGTYRLAKNETIQLELPAAYQMYPGVPSIDVVDDRGGWLFGPSLMYRRKFGVTSVNGGALFERQQARGDNYKMNGAGLLFGVSRPLPWNFNGRLGTGVTREFYPFSRSLRQDIKYDGSLELSRPLPWTKKMTGSLVYVYGRAISTVESANYHRNNIFLQVSYAL